MCFESLAKFTTLAEIPKISYSMHFHTFVLLCIFYLKCWWQMAFYKQGMWYVSLSKLYSYNNPSIKRSYKPTSLINRRIPPLVYKDSHFKIEPRKYKNDSIQSKIIPTLKLPRFFTTYTVRWKERQFQNWNYFWLNGVVLILYLL